MEFAGFQYSNLSTKTLCFPSHCSQWAGHPKTQLLSCPGLRRSSAFFVLWLHCSPASSSCRILCIPSVFNPAVIAYSSLPQYYLAASSSAVLLRLPCEGVAVHRPAPNFCSGLLPGMASVSVSDNPTPLVRSVDRSTEGHDASLAARVFGTLRQSRRVQPFFRCGLRLLSIQAGQFFLGSG